MRTPEQVREKLVTTWNRQWPEWLGGGGTWPKTFALDPPTECEAQRRWAEFTAWCASWSAKPLGGELRSVVKTWPTMGRQDVPTHMVFGSAAALAAEVGTAELFAVADHRWTERAAAWPDLAEALRGCAGWFGRMSDQDYGRFIAVVDWLSANRESGLYLRQLPVAGIDTKWTERHAGPIAKLLATRFGVAPARLELVAGLQRDPPRRRLRLLDPGLRARFGGLSDITVRLDELETLDLPVELAIVIENQVTALACEDLPGAIALMGGGFAVNELATVPWLARVPLIYWGDIDTAGFAILGALRQAHPQTISCLMDEETLVEHAVLWSDEDVPADGQVQGLTAAEAKLRQDLLDGTKWKRRGVRLEQERLPWPAAWAAICQLALQLRWTAVHSRV